MKSKTVHVSENLYIFFKEEPTDSSFMYRSTHELVLKTDLLKNTIIYQNFLYHEKTEEYTYDSPKTEEWVIRNILAGIARVIYDIKTCDTDLAARRYSNNRLFNGIFNEFKYCTYNKE